VSLPAAPLSGAGAAGAACAAGGAAGRSQWVDPGGSPMALRIVCMCGYVLQGKDDDELWGNVRHHMSVMHPELVDAVTREDILAQAELL
jgi:predicted small metal-binding protein